MPRRATRLVRVARAIALVRKVRPSAVLVDVILSDGRGLDLVRTARRGDSRPCPRRLARRGRAGGTHASVPRPHAHGLHGRDDAALGALPRGLLEDAPGAGA